MYWRFCMSSMYPFGGTATRPCMRCGTPLALNEGLCSRCGAYNPPAQGQVGAMQPVPGQGTAGLSWGAQSQFQQAGRDAWGATGGTGGWPQNSLFADQQQAQQSMPAPQFQQNIFGSPPGTGFADPHQSALYTGGLQQAHPPNSFPQQADAYRSALHTGGLQARPHNPFVGAPQQTGSQRPAPWNTQNNQRPAWMQQGAHDEDEGPGRKGPGAGVVLVILLLLLALLGGGAFAGYRVFFARNAASTAPNAPAVVTPSTPPLFHDTFQQNTANWDLTAPTGAKITLTGGKLLMESDNNKLYQEPFPGGKTYGDFRVDVDAGLSGGDPKNGYGVYVRGASAQNDPLGLFYRFEVYGDGYFYVYKGSLDANGNLQVQSIAQAEQPSDAIGLKGQMNHLTIIAQGQKLTWIINGTTVATLKDNSYKSGTMALFVSNVAKVPAGAQATFQNLAVFPAP